MNAYVILYLAEYSYDQMLMFVLMEDDKVNVNRESLGTSRDLLVFYPKS